MKSTFLMILIIIAIAALIPLAIIWALNTLFPVLAIPITFQTWLAASILSTPFVATKSK